ncbi:hypothetical protein WME79_42065 [Sorangium sp. So ce726]|uniref:hypothetical protein n=1 Tax=Sorangium sp. So ce726 TaxID=3133319 RepID=UPI003F5F7183
MTGMLRGGLWIGCAAAVVVTAAPASAMQPASGDPPAPAALPSVPAAAPAAGDAAAAPLLSPPAAGDAASRPPQPPAPGGGGAPPAGVAPPGAPQAPPGWTTSPGPWRFGSAPVHARPEPKRVWYGLPHLLALGGAVTLGPIAIATENEVLGVLGWTAAGAFVFGGPITHWANGHLGMGFASLGLTAGCTIGGGMAGLLIGTASNSGGRDDIAGLLAGGILGLVTANVIDIALLEHEEPPAAESYEYIRLRPLWLRFAPHVALAPGRTTFGLSGAF